ncbi:MAG: 2-oxoglutarate dehydrogenase, E2 component, dihydrolipoamide succinyltransferase [Ignavibacterium sp.]|jgi:2-oxoglutarate dehydrogenase E2 component (dihydrolipoamide succinyltransferase)|nr:2-oxoglutarate dehydrogenase, E2 component, dihydrolipoamide succinyltransferase [Ignavibacterium sp.]
MDIIMPKMGESVNEGTIIKWHKKVGDQVKRDEIIFEISTDKVDTEIPSAEAGVLTEILVKEGDTVEVGTVVARINSDDKSENKKVLSKESSAEKSAQTEVDQISPLERNVNDQSSSLEITSKPMLSGNIIEITMPKMGESVMEGTIIKWHKKVDEAVKKDETIFEISTDKVDTEIPSPEEGILAEILVGEQETVDVGVIVAKLSVGSDVKVSKSAVQEKVEDQVHVQEEKSMHDNFARNIDVRPKEQGTGSGFYSPLVLSIAQKENVSFEELKSIKGTGLEGRVSKKDILAFLEKRKTGGVNVQDQVKKEVTAAASPTFIPSTSQVVYNESDVEKIPMDNIRQRIMDHMVHSRDTSVHVTELIEVDMTRIHNFISTQKDEIMKNENAKITYMSFIADAVVKSLKKYPLVNSSIDGNTILQKKFINLGIAVAIEPTGLIVPNIKGAGDRNVIGLAKAIADLANRARTKKLTPDDISNGTFTITNYGVFGTIFGTPIINQPEVAILGVGAVQKKPVVIEVDGSDTFAVRHIMALTLSHDHRLVDGMLGGLFLKSIKEILENFEGII